MDQHLSTIIIAIITGIFSIITIIIQKKQDKVIDKIDEQTMFIEKEKKLKQMLTQKEKERENIIYDMMILILDTNLYILKNSTNFESSLLNDDVFKRSDELKETFMTLSDEIDNISKKYEMVLDMTLEFQREVEKMKNVNN